MTGRSIAVSFFVVRRPVVSDRDYMRMPAGDRPRLRSHQGLTVRPITTISWRAAAACLLGSEKPRAAAPVNSYKVKKAQ